MAHRIGCWKVRLLALRDGEIETDVSRLASGQSQRALPLSGDSPGTQASGRIANGAERAHTVAPNLGKQSDSKLVRVAFAARRVDSNDPFLFHKTTHRSVYETALRSQPDCDDVILWNERTEVTESTIANIVIELDGIKCTPPRTSGLLAGTFREELLETGKIEERVICKDELAAAEAFWLINSVRGWMPCLLLSDSA